MVKNLPVMRKTQVQSLGWGDPLEKGMATPPSILAWKISCDGLQSMGSQSQTRLSDRATDTFAFRFPMVGTLFFPLYPNPPPPPSLGAKKGARTPTRDHSRRRKRELSEARAQPLLKQSNKSQIKTSVRVRLARTLFLSSSHPARIWLVSAPQD